MAKSAGEEGKRIDVFLSTRLLGLSRSRICALIRDGQILINGHQCKPSHRVKPGDLILAHLPPVEDSVLAEPIDFDLLYEDSAIAVIDKPAGLVVHCATQTLSGTLVNGLLYRFGSLSSIGGPMRPGIVHRLDRDTSGIMVIAKTNDAHTNLVEQFKQRKVKKEYLAIVHGDMREGRREVELPVSRNPRNRKLMTARAGRGRASLTVLEPIERLGPATWVRIFPGTGRTHQVRVHLAAIGHPVVADKQYGGRSMHKRPRFGMIRQALHACRLAFNHPQTGDWVEFEANLPEDMRAALEALRSAGKAP